MMPFGTYSDEVIGHMGTLLSPMYQRVFREHWDNSCYSRMKRSYYHSDFMEGTVEQYIPTFHDPERNLRFHRIVLKVIPEMSLETFLSEAEKLEKRRSITPVGVVDSTTVFIVSPKLVRKGFIRSRRKPCNTFYCPIVARNPMTVVERFIKILTTFYTRRLKAFAESFHLSEKMDGWHCSLTSTLLYVFNVVVSKASDSLANSGRGLLHTVEWFKYKLAELYVQRRKEGRLSLMLQTIREFKPLLEDAKRRTSFDRRDNKAFEALICLCHGWGGG